MVEIFNLVEIKDVQVVKLKVHGDDRGSFTEMFRKEWFPQRSWEKMQTNRSVSKAKVLRGLHYHYHQVDYWFVPVGRVRAGLVDLRRSSPTFMTGHTIELDTETGLLIPVGVAHGFLAMVDSILVYVVDNYFDGKDEYGIAWNDPQVNLNWGISDPILSERDQKNAFLRDIAPESLPE